MDKSETLVALAT